MLGMDVYQAAAQVLQLVQGDGRIVDKSPAFAVGVQFASHNARHGIVFQVVFLEIGFQGTDIRKLGFDQAAFPALLDHLQVGTLAQDQSDSADQHRLAGTGLARDDRKAWGELQVDALDEDVIFDVQFV